MNMYLIIETQLTIETLQLKTYAYFVNILLNKYLKPQTNWFTVDMN